MFLGHFVQFNVTYRIPENLEDCKVGIVGSSSSIGESQLIKSNYGSVWLSGCDSNLNADTITAYIQCESIQNDYLATDELKECPKQAEIL
jgi:hypothetical protein